MRMLSTLVQVQTGHAVTAQSVLGQHALDGDFHSVVGAVLHHGTSLGLLQAADPAGYTVVDLLLCLLAGQNSLVGVDNDHVVTAVNVGSEVDLVLAAQQVGSDHSGTAQGLTGCIDDVPLTLHGLLLSEGSGHMGSSNFLVKYFDISSCLKYNIFKRPAEFITEKPNCQHLFIENLRSNM